MIKTKAEAIKLEKEIENIIGKNIVDDTVEVSMSLTGRLQVRFREGFINVNLDYKTIDFIKYEGLYESFIETTNKIISVLSKHKEELDLLIESYENRRNLK
jgi:hypothetical protein